jgi:hypothetical protein
MTAVGLRGFKHLHGVVVSWRVVANTAHGWRTLPRGEKSS